MFNPFPLFTKRILFSKIREGKRFFVRQTFARGLVKGQKASFLFKGYDEMEKNQAEKHLSNLVNDKNAFLYDARNKEHLERLETASLQPQGFSIFYAGTKKLEWKPSDEHMMRVRKYIGMAHPGWRTRKGGDKIEVGLYEEFGKLFLKLSFDDEEETIPFEKIEDYVS